MTDHTPTTAGQALDRATVLAAIPSNWLDALLTGPNAVLPKDHSYSPREIEKLLNAVRERIAALPCVNSHATNLTRITELEAEVKALREALKPFAMACENWSGDDSRGIITWPNDEMYDGDDLVEFTLGDLRRARSLIPESNNGEAGQ